jgi:protein-disulfide isomerase/rhodanese-related sulfurtransferase
MRKSLSLLLALLGLFDSLYLLWVYTSSEHTMVCLGTGCDTVRMSAFSHLWGIPMPVFGVAGYVIIAISIVLEALVSPARALDIRYALAGATAFGFFYSLYLEYLQGFVIHAFCAWCVTSGVVMTALAVLAMYNLVRPEPLSDPSARKQQVRRFRAVGIAAVLIGVPGFYELAKHGEAPPPPPAPTGSAAAMLDRPDSHVSGNPNAAVTVVEFGDFECPVCKREEPVAKEIRDKYKDKIRFVFRQFPLIHTHPFSERMAEASECAADQGKFWEAVEAIYAHQDELSDDSLRRSATEIGLDLGKFNQCLDSGSQKARVDRDRTDGKALGVNATPTFFIGHQVVEGVPEFDELSKMIDSELAGKPSGVPPAPIGLESASLPGNSSSNPAQTPANGAQNGTSAAPAAADPSASDFGLLGSSQGGALSGFQTGVACSEEDAAKKQPELINTEQLKALMDGESRILFVDVRTPQEHLAGNIPGSINVPVDDMPKKWSTLPKDRTIIFYESGTSKGDICASGRAAGRILLQNGYPYDHIKVYQDGLLGWQKSALITK